MKTNPFSLLAALLVSLFAPVADALAGYMQRSGLVLGVTAADFNNSRVTNPQQSELIRNTLYDSLLYPTAGQTQLSFFATPLGQGITSALGATVGTPKTYADTNLELAGQLPNGKSFLIESVEVLFLPGSVATANTYTAAALQTFIATLVAASGAAMNDVNSVMQSGWLELNVLSKNYLREAPLLKFPPKCHFEVDAAAAATAATVSYIAAMAKATGRPYYVDPNVTLQPAVNFEVLCKWPGAVATPSGFNGRMTVTLDGVFMRASQ